MADEHHEHHHHHHHKHMSRKKKNIIRISACAVFAVFAIVALVVIHRNENVPVATDSSVTETVETAGETTISYDGQDYTLRTDLETYLFMGIDIDGKVQVNDSPAGAGQADLILLAIVDDANQTIRFLHINRDSMTDVTVLGVLGDKVGTEYEQICLAHAYGDGEDGSCENVVDTVSNLLDGVTIDGYVSLNMDGIAVINDAFGGVTVTVEDDFSDVDPALVQGEEITLMGDQAETFVRSRSEMPDSTNLNREKRQREYLTALGEKARDLDTDQLLTIYDEAEDYIVTNMGSKTLYDLFEKLGSYTYEGIETLEGESIVVDNVNTYELDQDSLQETIRSLFYTKQN